MSIDDLRFAIARHIRDAIPGHEVDDYLRAARAISSLWRPRDGDYEEGARDGADSPM